MGRILSPEPHGPLAPPPASAGAGHAAADPIASAAPDALAAPDAATATTQPMTPPVGRPAERARATHAPNGTSWRDSLWRAIKWPLRKLLLGVYLAGEALERRSRVALATLALVGVALIALMAAGALLAARAEAPSAASQAVVAVERPAQPALPASVLRFLGARQRFNAVGMWNACDAQGQHDMQIPQSQLQPTLNQLKQAGEVVKRYVSIGGYRSSDGIGRYTVAAYITDHGQTSVSTWYFEVGTNGLIHQFVVLPS